MTSPEALISKVWSYALVLRADGVSYGDYVEQITCLLFLKKDQKRYDHLGEVSRIRRHGAGPLNDREGEDLELQYRHTLEELARESGLLGTTFRKAQNKIQDPANLRRLVAMIDDKTGIGLKVDVKAEIYEGLLERNAPEGASTHGHAARPRPSADPTGCGHNAWSCWWPSRSRPGTRTAPGPCSAARHASAGVWRRHPAGPARPHAASFFSRQALGDEEPADRCRAHVDRVRRQASAQLGEREIRLGRDQRMHPLGLIRQRRTFPAAVPVWRDRAVPSPALHQLDHEADADLEPAHRRPPRQSSLDRTHHPLAKVHRIGSCHPRWPPYPAASLNQQPHVVNT